MNKRVLHRLLLSHLAVGLFVFLIYFCADAFIESSVSKTGFVILSAICAAALSAWLIYKPLQKRIDGLIRFCANVSAGNHKTPNDISNDEIGALTSTLSMTFADLKQQSAQLEDNNDRMRTVLKSMSEAVIVIDTHQKIILHNMMATRLFGPKLNSKKFIEISRNPKLLETISQDQKRWEPVSEEIELTAPSPMTMLVVISPFIRDVKILGSVIVFHDITMLKKLETVRKDFVANVSHELKTPLTSIKGYAETLIEGAIDDTENAVKFTKIIKKNADHLSRLVDDLLTLSNIELGKLDFNIQQVSLLDAAQSALSTLEPRRVEKGLEIRIDIAEKLTAMADPDRLEQILLNLIDNAIKYTPKGRVTISASNEGERVRVCVTDQGIGIPEKDISRIGERFYRVDPARSREMGGTGLGLAIVKHLLNSMDAALEIRSKQGAGASVSFTLQRR